MDFKESFTQSFKKWKRPKKTDNRGNIEGLAKYIAHRIGGDPHLWTKCMAFEKLQGYDHEARAAICARVHKIVTGYWTREKKPAGWSPADNKYQYDPSKKENFKGGPGSGNFGHYGLPKVWGGSRTDNSPGVGQFDADKYNSMSVPDRKKAFFGQSQHAIDSQAAASTKIQETIQQRLSNVGERPNTGNIRQDVIARMGQCAHMTVPENAEMITDTIFELDSLLESMEIDNELRRKITMDALDNLIVQDNESISRQLGDHGIHHIRGNIVTNYQILKEVPGAETAESMAEIYLTHIYHDTGYLTEPARMFLDDAHPRWSRQHYDKNVKADVARVLGKESAEHISFLIESHASANINWKEDAIASSVRVADNLGLFQKEKLPQLFRSVPQNVAVLEQLQLGKLTEAQANAKMIANINAMDFTPEVRSQLIKAAREANRFTPKFTLGMLGGDIDSFEWRDGYLRVYLRKNSQATRLQKIFDLGQRQFAKFAKTYGVDWKMFRGKLSFKFPPQGETLLESVVVGEKEKQTLLKIFEELFADED